tara:strand:+ start:421 stop:984 length:564 start_codon:yes stop_codon:yes gene_type:complete
MVKNKDLKCFVGTAKNGAKYRACLPKKNKPYKAHQDLRGNPHPEGKRKQPRQLAYEGGVKAYKKAPARKAREAKAGVDSGRATIMRRWKKKIDSADSKEEKKELSVKMNKALARYEAKKKKDTHKMPDGSVMDGKKHPVKKPNFKVVGKYKKKEPAKKPNFKVNKAKKIVDIVKKDGSKVRFTVKKK